MVRTQFLPGQLPLFVPESDWTPPTELPDLRQHKYVALDTETRDLSLAAGMGSGWPYGNTTLCGVSAAWEGGAFYAPIAHPDTSCFNKQSIADWIKDHDEAGVRFIFHNAPYDCGTLLMDAGVPIVQNIDDTTAMAVMVNENRYDYTLEGVCRWLGIPGKDETLLNEAAAVFGFGKDIKGNLYRLPGKYVGPYAEADAICTFLAAKKLRPILDEQQTVDAYQLEMDLIPMVLEMRRKGIRIDIPKAEKTRDILITRRDQLLQDLSNYLGQTVSMIEINSAYHVEKWFVALKIPFGRTEISGQGKFDNEFLENHIHELPRKITQIRQIEVAQKKFLQGFLLDYSHKGRIHASINQFKSESGGTKTHRMSYSDPPLQQMYGKESTDLKKELVPLIRGCFLPEEGEIWGACDFSQQEYRLIVHYCELMNLPKAKEAADRYRTDPDTDFHNYVVEITKLDRSRAKDVNFAKSYSASVSKFALMTKMSLEEAQIRIEDKTHPWKGRLIRSYTWKAFNHLIQGSAARQTKKAMKLCWDEKFVPLIQMHDELGFSLTEERQGEKISELMRDAIKLNVPMKVDTEYGDSWGTARKIKGPHKEILYDATWQSAQRLKNEGKWW